MICTSIEQSKHLLELGLDPKTADMCFEMYKGNWALNVGKKSAQVNRGLAIPAWSLSALLKVMPKEELVDLSVSKDGYWFCSGVHFDTPIYSNPIDAAYAQVYWLLEQGLIKKVDNDE